MFSYAPFEILMLRIYVTCSEGQAMAPTEARDSSLICAVSSFFYVA